MNWCWYSLLIFPHMIVAMNNLWASLFCISCPSALSSSNEPKPKKPPRGEVHLETAATTAPSARAELSRWGEAKHSVAAGTNYAAATFPTTKGRDSSTSSPPVRRKRDSNVMFMWQPLTESASFSSVTLLASFQVSMQSRDPYTLMCTVYMEVGMYWASTFHCRSDYSSSRKCCTYGICP